MTPQEIKLELYKRRSQITQTQIARNLDVSRTAIHLVIHRQFISNRIMEAVSDAIKFPKEQVFPEYYMKKAS